MMNYKEIAEEVFDIESEALSGVKNLLSDSFIHSVEAILETKGRVVVTGMGKSGIVGHKIAASLSSTGTPAVFLHPAEAYHGDLGIIKPSDIILAISNSGETDEVIKLLSFFRENGNKVIAMTGEDNSTLSRHADFFLNIKVTKEACPLELAPTSSTTATMVMGDALVVALMKTRSFEKENFAKFHPGGSLGRKLLNTAEDMMKSEKLPTVSEEDNFESIISSIGNGRLGLTVVVDQKFSIRGVVTDGDIRRAISEHKEKVLSLKASDLLTKNPIIVKKNTKLVEVEKIFLDKKITAVLVSDSEKLEGILHLYDL